MPARQAGVKVVQVCGFEALPPDLLVPSRRDRARAPRRGPRGRGRALQGRRLPGGAEASTGSPGTFQSLARPARPTTPRCSPIPPRCSPTAASAEAVRRTSPILVRPRRASDGTVIARWRRPRTSTHVIHPPACSPLRPRIARALVTARGSRSRPPVTSPAALAAAGMLSGTQASSRRSARAPAGPRKRMSSSLSACLPSPASARRRPARGVALEHARGRHHRGGHEVRADVQRRPPATWPRRGCWARRAPDGGAGATPGAAGCLTPAAALGTAAAERMAAAGSLLLAPAERSAQAQHRHRLGRHLASPSAFGWTITGFVPCSTGSTQRTPMGLQASWPFETVLRFT